jgi:uncharacterized surface protein with fasciclin (FAS1) repeats
MKTPLKLLTTLTAGLSVPLAAETYQADREKDVEEVAAAVTVVEKAAAAEPTLNIVETAMENSEFSTLVAALKAAGLVEALQGEGPLTVFAPTNAAFEKLPEGSLEDLLKAENKDKLGEILKFHVSGGKLMAEDLTTTKVETLNGQPLTVIVDGEDITVDGASFENTDIVTTNGVIHVVDTVLLPSEE